MNLKLRIWRQKDSASVGKFVMYSVNEVSRDMSFLEMLDVLNEQLVKQGEEPVAFDSDCREGICGSCGFMINGLAQGGEARTTVCQLHMRHFKDGDELTLEPFRAGAFPVIKDLAINRQAFDRIITAGGYISCNAGAAPEGNTLPVGKQVAELAFDAASCIGCGACVAACKNASAMLFVSAKLGHLSLLPQGKIEEDRRVVRMIAQMEKEKFGACTNEAECSAVCPKGISFKFISRMNKQYLKAELCSETSPPEGV